MYEIIVEDHFDSAHFLRGYGGKCENLHGHSYSVRVRLKTEKLNDIGLGYDFNDLKRNLAEIIAKYDHCLLNEIPPFDRINPSAENIATTIYHELEARLSREPVSISAVEAWETPGQGVIYTP